MCSDQHVKYRMPCGFPLTSSLLLDFHVKQNTHIVNFRKNQWLFWMSQLARHISNHKRFAYPGLFAKISSLVYFQFLVLSALFNLKLSTLKQNENLSTQTQEKSTPRQYAAYLNMHKNIYSDNKFWLKTSCLSTQLVFESNSDNHSNLSSYLMWM